MIEFEGVRYVYPNGVEALKGVSLRIGEGELVALVGPNGAGKTTLIKHMNGLLKPTEGRVRVFGIDTRKASVAELSRRVGIVFQNSDRQLFSETVEEEIRFGLENFGFSKEEASERVEEMLERFGLEPYRNTSPFSLSGGEKKRLCIALVLAWDPDVLVLDEPTVGQDWANKEKIRGLIESLLKEGKSVVVSSHDLEFVWSLKPRVLVMSDGRVVMDGRAEEVLSRDGIEEFRLLRPRLLELYMRLKKKPRRPFFEVRELEEWVKVEVGG